MCFSKFVTIISWISTLLLLECLLLMERICAELFACICRSVFSPMVRLEGLIICVLKRSINLFRGWFIYNIVISKGYKWYIMNVIFSFVSSKNRLFQFSYDFHFHFSFLILDSFQLRYAAARLFSVPLLSTSIYAGRPDWFLDQLF